MNPTVAFTEVLSEPAKVEAEYVTRSGLIFRAGEYPDKDFSMTAEELAAAVAAFTPQDVDLEHTDTVLSGKLGRVESVSLADDGNSLHGVVRLPKWLDDAMGETERKVSATWNRATKHLEGLALVLSPRVADAALMSAYAAFAARHDTPTGQAAMARIHQVAAESGAVCSKGNVAMASGHEASAIQKIHDLTTEHGAPCSSVKSGVMPYPMFGVDAPTAPASPASTATTSPKEGRTMSGLKEFKDRMIAALSGMPDDESGEEAPKPAPTPPTPPQPVPAPAAMSTADAEFTRMRQERDAAQAEASRLRVEGIRKDAANFADKFLTAGKITPAMRAALIAKYECDALDDASYGQVSFGSEGKQAPRVSLLEEIFANAMPNQLSADSLAPALMSVLQGHRETPAQDANRKLTPDELEKLLGFSDTGRALLAETRGTNSAGKTNGRA